MINNDSRDDSLEGLLIELAESINKLFECKLPCVVTAVSSDRTRVSVRPLIHIIGRDDQPVTRDIIEGLPVYQAGAGDFLMSFPVVAGNIGWIEAADRDLGIFLQAYDVSDPGSRRKHSFSDAVFVPDIMTNFSIAEEDSAAVVIQNRTGTVKIAMDGDQIRIANGDTRIEIDDGIVTGTAPSGFFLNGAEITPGGNVITASGVSVDDHPHNQGNDSDGNSQVATNPPTPTA